MTRQATWSALSMVLVSFGASSVMAQPSLRDYTVGAKEGQVFFADIDGLGPCHMVPLADVDNLPDHDSARTVAEALAGAFEQALVQAGEQREVGDPGRRLGPGAYLLKVGKRRFARARLS